MDHAVRGLAQDQRTNQGDASLIAKTNPVQGSRNLALFNVA